VTEGGKQPWGDDIEWVGVAKNGAPIPLKGSGWGGTVASGDEGEPVTVPWGKSFGLRIVKVGHKQGEGKGGEGRPERGGPWLGASPGETLEQKKKAQGPNQTSGAAYSEDRPEKEEGPAEGKKDHKGEGGRADVWGGADIQAFSTKCHHTKTQCSPR